MNKNVMKLEILDELSNSANFLVANTSDSLVLNGVMMSVYDDRDNLISVNKNINFLNPKSTEKISVTDLTPMCSYSLILKARPFDKKTNSYIDDIIVKVKFETKAGDASLIVKSIILKENVTPLEVTLLDKKTNKVSKLNAFIDKVGNVSFQTENDISNLDKNSFKEKFSGLGTNITGINQKENILVDSVKCFIDSDNNFIFGEITASPKGYNFTGPSKLDGADIISLRHRWSEKKFHNGFKTYFAFGINEPVNDAFFTFTSNLTGETITFPRKNNNLFLEVVQTFLQENKLDESNTENIYHFKYNLVKNDAKDITADLYFEPLNKEHGTIHNYNLNLENKNELSLNLENLQKEVVYIPKIKVSYKLGFKHQDQEYSLGSEIFLRKPVVILPDPVVEPISEPVILEETKKENTKISEPKSPAKVNSQTNKTKPNLNKEALDEMKN